MSKIEFIYLSPDGKLEFYDSPTVADGSLALGAAEDIADAWDVVSSLVDIDGHGIGIDLADAYATLGEHYGLPAVDTDEDDAELLMIQNLCSAMRIAGERDGIEFFNGEGVED